MDLSKRWLYVVGFSLAGFLLLRWADDQFGTVQQISSSTFELPVWRILGGIVTLIAVGVAFGLAALAARTGTSHSHVGATLVALILPAAIVAYYWTFISFGWLRLPSSLSWMLSESTISVSAAAVGFLLVNFVPIRGPKSD